jgi:YgiT-type zinc finger domain-containing protein
MKCVICKNGDTKQSKTVATFEKRNSTIIFKSVPCLKCEQCGEIYFEEIVSSKLMSQLNKISEHAGEVNIQQFNAA